MFNFILKLDIFASFKFFASKSFNVRYSNEIATRYEAGGFQILFICSIIYQKISAIIHAVPRCRVDKSRKDAIANKT